MLVFAFILFFLDTRRTRLTHKQKQKTHLGYSILKFDVHKLEQALPGADVQRRNNQSDTIAFKRWDEL